MHRAPERASDGYFRALAEFRYQIRRFTSFSEQAAEVAGVAPQQHLLLLALRGLPAGMQPSIRGLADRLLLRHHSVVELVDRSVRMGLVRRVAGLTDRRQVMVELTARGERVLQKIFVLNRRQLRVQSSELARTLGKLTREQNGGRRRHR
ncbi:MAG: MarR family transcriptional regulator [Acidobacteriota bacterium]|nr:MarR family transcriptional regulator [Acidobacteriota bacterium]